MTEVLAVAALVISGAALLLLVRVAGRMRPAAPPPQSAAGAAQAPAPAVEPPPAGSAPDGQVLVRLDLLEAKVAVLEARSAQPLPPAPPAHADEPRAADGGADGARRPHPMFP